MKTLATKGPEESCLGGSAFVEIWGRRHRQDLLRVGGSD